MYVLEAVVRRFNESGWKQAKLPLTNEQKEKDVI